MPITKSVKKSLRSSLRKKVYNDRRRRNMKSVLKDIKKSTLAKDKKGAEAMISKAYKVIDKATKNGVIKKNTAARKKSRLVASIRKIA